MTKTATDQSILVNENETVTVGDTTIRVLIANNGVACLQIQADGDLEIHDEDLCDE